MPRRRQPALLSSDLITLSDAYDIELAGRRYLVGPCKRDRSGVRIMDESSGAVLWEDELRVRDVLRFLRAVERAGMPEGGVKK